MSFSILSCIAKDFWLINSTVSVKQSSREQAAFLASSHKWTRSQVKWYSNPEPHGDRDKQVRHLTGGHALAVLKQNANVLFELAAAVVTGEFFHSGSVAELIT
jgi:hypothetical protein